MGYRRTIKFITLTYITLKQLFSGLVSPKNLMGPVGIIAMSYQVVAREPPVVYAYFLGLISATIAVINFLPVPPFDGGLVVLMLVEKIKGSALSERTQGILAYAGWAMVLVLLVYVTFNDIVRTFFS
jgi:regulator of sigma E protease